MDQVQGQNSRHSTPSKRHTSKYKGQLAAGRPKHSSTPIKAGSAYSSKQEQPMSKSSAPEQNETQSMAGRSLKMELQDCSLPSCDSTFNTSLEAGNTSGAKSLTAAGKARVAEFENTTILKQRQELQLLITELRDRDRELNEMVAAHQQQLAAWDQDRKKLLRLEEKYGQLEGSLHSRNDELRQLVAQVRVMETEHHNKCTALESAQQQLTQLSEQKSHSELHIQELQTKSRSLDDSLREMSSNVGELEAREEELITVLQKKDRDLSEASSRVAELCAKLKRMDGRLHDSQASVSDLRRQVTEWRNKQQEANREAEHLKRELVKAEHCAELQRLEIQKLKQDASTVRKEVVLATEREKRKDQLLQLQKSKQERSDAELSDVRELYERQQKDLSLLHLSLEHTKELLAQQQPPFNINRSVLDADVSHTSQQSLLKRGSPARQEFSSISSPYQCTDSLPSPIGRHDADTSAGQLTPCGSPRSANGPYLQDRVFSSDKGQDQGTRSWPARSSLYYTSPQSSGAKVSGEHSSSTYTSSHFNAQSPTSRSAGADSMRPCPQAVSVELEGSRTTLESQVLAPGKESEQQQQATPSEELPEHQWSAMAPSDQPSPVSTNENQVLKTGASPGTSVKSDTQCSMRSAAPDNKDVRMPQQMVANAQLEEGGDAVWIQGSGSIGSSSVANDSFIERKAQLTTKEERPQRLDVMDSQTLLSVQKVASWQISQPDSNDNLEQVMYCKEYPAGEKDQPSLPGSEGSQLHSPRSHQLVNARSYDSLARSQTSPVSRSIKTGMLIESESSQKSKNLGSHHSKTNHGGHEFGGEHSCHTTLIHDSSVRNQQPSEVKRSLDTSSHQSIHNGSLKSHQSSRSHHSIQSHDFGSYHSSHKSHESLSQHSDVSQRSHHSTRSYDARSHSSNAGITNLALPKLGRPCDQGNDEHQPKEDERRLDGPSEQGDKAVDDHQCFTPLAPDRASTPLSCRGDSGTLLGRELQSPATKLHILLAESQELAKNLERSSLANLSQESRDSNQSASRDQVVKPDLIDGEAFHTQVNGTNQVTQNNGVEKESTNQSADFELSIITDDGGQD